MIELPVPSTASDRLAALVCHGTFLVGIPVAGPVVVLLLAQFGGPSSPYVRQQAWQSLVFQLVVTLIFFAIMAVAVGMGLLSAFQLAAEGGIPEKSALWGIGTALLACLFGFWAVIIEALAVVAVAARKPHKLPFVGRLGL